MSFASGLVYDHARRPNLTELLTNELGRLAKILDRVDDAANFAGERQNASRLL